MSNSLKFSITFNFRVQILTCVMFVDFPIVWFITAPGAFFSMFVFAACPLSMEWVD